MTSVFVLQHVHEMDDGTEDVKFIGVYSSRQKAQAAAERLRAAPGFSDSPDGFSIDEYGVDHDHWAEGYVAVTHS
jgi:hypothetical protein